jgi:hypothetical protein
VKIVRKITYEVPDTVEGLAWLKRQIAGSLPEGTHRRATTITVEHLEGPKLDEEGRPGWYTEAQEKAIREDV